MMNAPLVILAGGLGTRLREETEFRPKPMVEIGGKPIIWHIMKYYSTWGIKEFIICTGYKGEFIKNYFLNYRNYQSDITVSLGKHQGIQIHKDVEEDWKVTIVDTSSRSQSTLRRIISTVHTAMALRM
jgi:glucose-1-phosphate cytidylyltransferase